MRCSTLLAQPWPKSATGSCGPGGKGRRRGTAAPTHGNLPVPPYEWTACGHLVFTCEHKCLARSFGLFYFTSLSHHGALISIHLIIQCQITVSNGSANFIQLGSSQGGTAVPVHWVLDGAVKSAWTSLVSGPPDSKKADEKSYSLDTKGARWLLRLMMSRIWIDTISVDHRRNLWYSGMRPCAHIDNWAFRPRLYYPACCA